MPFNLRCSGSRRLASAERKAPPGGGLAAKRIRRPAAMPGRFLAQSAARQQAAVATRPGDDEGGRADLPAESARTLDRVCGGAQERRLSSLVFRVALDKC